jgi:hypothetical protein
MKRSICWWSVVGGVAETNSTDGCRRILVDDFRMSEVNSGPLWELEKVDEPLAVFQLKPEEA